MIGQRFNPAHVSHIFATLGKSKPGFGLSNTHPFVVYMVDSNGTPSQEIMCRSLRGCLICGNGMAAALMACQIKLDRHNVEFDTRFDWVSE